MKKSCNNCADYIVCYGMDEITEDKGENCPNWHLDFIDFQNMFLANMKEEETQDIP